MRIPVSLSFLVIMTVLVLAPGIPRESCVAAKSAPMTEATHAQVGSISGATETKVPIITWGGDVATILANGNSRTTSKNSVFGTSGLKFELVRMDDFKKQVEMFIRGETPYLRGTMGMINMAAEVLSRDPRTTPIVIYQMTWSAGGDCLVVKGGIKTVKDLKGKTIAVQAYGPHVDYLGTLLKGAGLSAKDVTIRWTDDLTGTDKTPATAFQKENVDAAFVIIPDGLMLTSGGTVGTGAEGSIKGARILLSTKTANRIIADVYAVRSDYFDAHRDKVQAFVHGLFLAEQQTKELFANKDQRKSEFKDTVTASAQILFDSPQAIPDAEALYADCEYVGFPGNVKFFGDPDWPRSFARLTEEIQSTLVSIGLMAKKTPLQHAVWDYNVFRPGLKGIEAVQAPKFKPEDVAKVVERRRAMGALEEGELFSFEIYFSPNQNTFAAETYADDFEKVVQLASTFGGAIIIVEGHSDPSGYLGRKKKGATEVELKRIEQAAKNLSLTRSISVRDSAMDWAKTKHVSLDPSQFTVVGHGIRQPKSGMCGNEPCAPKTKEEWLSNMRVTFRIIQVEAETSVFTPLE
ncbi:MAG: ABC transporter substrate-binding protein [Desulfomonile tiedjei]|uniref:ABC transporter substrate-binding protein n=1 Tax=Desulfomonile tiedjei TaxID=2358 RepID=A0A9D6UYJ9_9BACT|nr:ABC transporter substrate-binding protein [Desulfomonile tiedjei]